MEADKQNNVGATKGHAVIDRNRLKGEEPLEGFCLRRDTVSLTIHIETRSTLENCSEFFF
jgi:hypothetical protein